jgi:hypothetical protein
MPEAEKTARTDVRRAQAAFERKHGQLVDARVARRESFERAQAAGLSMRDIANETGLHYTRVAQILQAK